MKVYLAHNFAAQEYLKGVAESLTNAGIEVTSRWIWGEPDNKRETALMDMADVLVADFLVLFTENYGPIPGKGKYVELGIAAAAHKPIILVGPDDACIFFNLPGVFRVESIEGAMCLLLTWGAEKPSYDRKAAR
jgi:hypothetical protein